MAYDPYKSLLANASRDHLKRGTDLNTHLVGNVFLPAIDSQHQKPSTSTNSFKHLKVIEQCIMAENKREERLANCATNKERRILTKKFQIQRERERELIQALMLGDYPDQHQHTKPFKTEVVAVKTPRQQFHQDITGLSARVATPDRVFRKADVTGGIPKSKPHAHKQFKLPECNGSPGRKINTKSQDAASTKLSSRIRTPPSSRETQIIIGDSPSRKKRSPSRSAKNESSVRSPNDQVKISSDDTTTAVTKAATSSRSSMISMHRHQSRSASATPHLSALPDADIEGQHEEFPVVIEGTLNFSEAQQLAEAMGSDAQMLKEKCEKVLAEMSTQTTLRIQVDAIQEGDIQKATSRPELPPMNPLFVAPLNQDVSATPRRPQSDRVKRSTRQAFLENLAKENQILQDRKKSTAQHEDSVDEIVAGSKTIRNDQNLAEEKSEVREKENQIMQDQNENESTAQHEVTADEVDGSETTHEDQKLTEEDKVQVSEKGNQILQDQKDDTAQLEDAADKVDTGSETTRDEQSFAEENKSRTSKEDDPTVDALEPADDNSPEPEYSDDEDFAADNDSTPNAEADDELETYVAETLFGIVDMVEAAIAEEKQKPVLPTLRTVSSRPQSSTAEEEEQNVIIPSPRTLSPRPQSSLDRTKLALRIQSLFRGYRARIAFRLALYEEALSCGVLGAMPGTIQGRSGWYLDPKHLMAYYFVIPDPDSEWEQKYALRCSRLVLTPYEMQQEVLSKVPALVLQTDVDQKN